MAAMRKPRAGGHLGALLLAGLIIGVCAPAIAQVWSPPGWDAPEDVTVSEEELLLQEPYTRHFRSRYWYFNGLLEGGTTFTISLFQWRSGAMGGPGLLVLVNEPGREPFVLETRIEERGFEESRDRLQIRFGDSELSGSRYGATVRLRLEEFSCDLWVANLLNPWKPGDGYVHLSPRRGAYTRQTVVSPFATVSGWMRVSGREIPARGYCYSDRGLVNLPLNRMNPEEFSFRVFGSSITPEEDPWMISMLESVTAEAYGSRRISALLVGRGEQWILASGAFGFQATDYLADGRSPLPYPSRLKVQAEQDGYLLEGEFVVTHLYALSDILARLPAVFREVAELLIKRPVIHRLAGYFLGSLEFPDGGREILYLLGQAEYSVFR